jgi:hypothetical protein
MSIFFEDHKNIFEILKEDDGSDIINGGDAGATDADSTVDNGGGDADASTTTDDTNNDNGGDEDFDIDTSLDDGGDDDTGNEEGGDSDLDDSSSDLDSSSGSTSEDEAIPANKDIFTTLTAEEQAIKIKEQKKQFNNMYIYIDDLIDKISDVQLDEDNTMIIERISKRLYNLREYLNDYITSIYPTKDFISNDIFYNRFLQILYSIDSTMLDLAKSRAKKIGIELDENEKK